jgi:hypothetical protein
LTVSLVHTDSLAATVDAVNEAFFFGRRLSKDERRRAANWIAARRGLKGCYAGMFAPTDRDFDRGLTLFTGERIATRAGSAHILGEEACRAMILLDCPTPKAKDALAKATAGILDRLGPVSRRRDGRFCCAKCSCAYWRHLAAGGLADQDEQLRAATNTLKDRRGGDGKWQGFPFYYTLLALSEMDVPGAFHEMLYAAPVLERYLKHPGRDGEVNRRRRFLAQKVLARC